ncbi:RNA polymerase sigma-70 factor, ECF subfamily [Marinobacter segnicrescens]|uniref:RNA polymerase sigma-70 factor, ECF subfamily n=1 Tax=Marinobacter segnicrescens TaxID=430453 RepID=A0A1I0GMD3_9GAMM|nr:RNA polymerase sigma-70 factor, ECF subfamily [Marinobacter segnicrescens]
MDLEQLYQQHSRQVLATLIRLTGEFELAEECLQEAFAAALAQWPSEGTPGNPVAWLVRTGHHKAIDHIRRQQTARRHSELLTPEVEGPSDQGTAIYQDDLLRLIFTCCHPALGREAQLALTLREVCGLTTEQVARALLQKPATLAQRIVRAKRKVREARIPYEVPDQRELPTRLPPVLQVIYLMFNEGYSATEGARVVDVSLAAEAIRLGAMMSRLLPRPEVYGLLALLLLHDARWAAREDGEGNLVTLEEQDRSLWDQGQIEQGRHWLMQALAHPDPGPYTLQAAIAASHADAKDPASTDWAEIAALYGLLYQKWPTPVVALNRAVAIAMRDGPAHGLALLDQLAADKVLQSYHLFHAARADLYRRCGDRDRARLAYQQALTLVRQEPERRFLQRRLEELSSS